MNKHLHDLFLMAKNIKNLSTITDRNGVSIDKKKSYPGALKSAESGTEVREKGVIWHPIARDGESWGVYGLKPNKNIKEEILIIEKLISQLEREEFTKNKAQKMLGPKSSFIKNLLTTEKIKNIDEAIDGADIVGLNLRSPQAVMLIKIPGLLEKIHQETKNKHEDEIPFAINEEYRKIIGALKKGFSNYEQNIFTVLEPETLVCLKWARGQINTLNTVNFFREKAEYIAEIIKKEVGIKPTIGVGQYYPGLPGLRKSYSDALITLELGEKIWGPERIYHITDVGMFVALSRSTNFDRKCELSNQIIGPIFEDPDLYKTVAAFLDSDMSLTAASKKMHIHRNTLIYRLDKIKKETGLDPRVFSDAVQIKLGTMLYGPALTKN